MKSPRLGVAQRSEGGKQGREKLSRVRPRLSDNPLPTPEHLSQVTGKSTMGCSERQPGHRKRGLETEGEKG